LWVNHISSLKAGLGLDDGALGLTLFLASLGSLAGMGLFGRMSARLGLSRATRVLAVLCPLGPALPALAGGVPGFALALFVLGAILGLSNVALNTVATCSDTPIIGRCHALWSGGNIVGSAAVGIALHAGWPPLLTTLVVGGTLAVVAAWLGIRLPVALSRPTSSARPMALPGRVWAFGSLVAGALLCEGAVGDWSAVYLHDALDASMATSALAYGCFCTAGVIGRLASDRMLALVGPARLLAAGGVIAAGGVLSAVLVAVPVLALAGWGLTGLGLSVAMPLLIGNAGQDARIRERAVARVSAVGYLGLLSGPPLIGTLSRWVGLGHALLLLAACALMVGGYGARLVGVRPAVAERECSAHTA